MQSMGVYWRKLVYNILEENLEVPLVNYPPCEGRPGVQDRQQVTHQAIAKPSKEGVEIFLLFIKQERPDRRPKPVRSVVSTP